MIHLYIVVFNKAPLPEKAHILPQKLCTQWNTPIILLRYKMYLLLKTPLDLFEQNYYLNKKDL